MAKLLADFPSGPLDRYRNVASFDWKKMKTFIETEEIMEFQNQLYEELQQHPILQPENFQTQTLQEQRRIAALRVLTLNNIECFSLSSVLQNLRKPAVTLTTMIHLDPSTIVKHGIAFGMFPSVIRSLGTKHHQHYLQEILEGNIIGAYCLTEIAHGSNAKCMQTTATFDVKMQEFILHTPNFQAAKCWAGVLGQMATHVIVYAQLVTSDGHSHGLHSFVLQIRDSKTHLPFPGLTIGDMGEKIGLNGVDNGFIMFNNFRVPKTALLNKMGDVTVDGKYVTPYRDPNKRYGASLGALSMGRVVITCICSAYCSRAITIALRYAGVRTQFGAENDEELPILEYQNHQYRLIPYLAVAYVLKMFSDFFMQTQYQFTIDSLIEGNKDALADLGMELHALSSAAKPVSGWVVQGAVQECREACAGHGYLKVAGLGDIKNAHDANCTYEGENHVLIQQTSNWLLKLWPLVLKGQNITFPLKSVNFLTNSKRILTDKLQARNVDEFIQPNNILNIYKWLVCYLLKMSYEKCESLIQTKKLDSFEAKNQSQVFFCKNLAIVYIQHFMLQNVYEIITQATDPAIKNVLGRLISLYGIWSLEKHTTTLYQGRYASGPQMATLLQESILKLCGELKNEAIALVDAIAPPDFLMQSVLGHSDGLVYKRLEAALLQSPDALTKPEWWHEISHLRNAGKSKL